ncbi:MAG: patatin-like phospholipase family protein, partial [Christensenellales bacterium]
WDDKILCEDGLVNSVPVNVCKALGADVVIAVDVNSTRGDGKDIKGITDVISSTIGIMLKSNATSYLDMADIVLSPNLKKFKSSKLVGDAKEMIEEGENVVLSRKDEIIKLLNQKPRKNKIKWIQKDVEHI